MSAKINSELRSQYPFWQLEREQQSSIPKRLQAQYGEQNSSNFQAWYTDVMQVMLGKKQAHLLTPQAQQLLKDLNQEARKVVIFSPLVASWQQRLSDSEILTDLLPLGAKIALGSAIIPAGVMLLYLRSHKILAVANGCAACALLVLHSICWKWKDALCEHFRLIAELDINNFDQFEGKVLGVYEGLKKSNVLVRFYLNAHQKRIVQCKGSQLLYEQLYAFFQIKYIVQKLMLGPSRTASSEAGKVDLQKMGSFFIKFGALCRKGMYLSGAVGLGALGWTYYAYVQKARLMVVAGTVCLLGSWVFSRELFVLQEGSRYIGIFSRAGKCEAVTSEFRAMAKRSRLLSRLGLQPAKAIQIRNVVVIPFDEILTLIPGWKQPTQNMGSVRI